VDLDEGAVKTLFLPFETGELGVGGHWLFLNAFVPPQACPIAKTRLIAVQGMRPLFNALGAAGLAVSPNVPEGRHNGALVLISRHRAESRAFLNQALDHVVSGGLIIFAGAKNDGVAAMAKEVSGRFELLGSLSKHHAKVFWFEKTDIARFDEASPVLVDGGFETGPGMFSSGHIDPGSAFLVEQLPKDIGGAIADFCAGWGYLSVCAAERFAAVESIALFEAGHASLEAAKVNMARFAPRMSATFHWRDLAGEEVSGGFDAVIMNPPFHQGRAADPAIGNAIIRNAANALRRGGGLYLVANRALPYEQTLSSAFRKSGELARSAAYKVLWAQK
jgi:16S rRNA (guanine1207-N2)-methyltransferase